MRRPSNFFPRPLNVGDYPLGDGPSYADDVEPLEAELRTAAAHPEYGIDVPAVEAALAEAKADERSES